MKNGTDGIFDGINRSIEDGGIDDGTNIAINNAIEDGIIVAKIIKNKNEPINTWKPCNPVVK